MQSSWIAVRLLRTEEYQAGGQRENCPNLQLHWRRGYNDGLD